MSLDRYALWRAGKRALGDCSADEEALAMWEKTGLVLLATPESPPEIVLRNIATALDGLGTKTARAYAQACDALADRFASGDLSEESLFYLARRVKNLQISPQLRFVGKMLQALGALKHVNGAQRGLFSAGLEALESEPAARFDLAARVFVMNSPLGEEEPLSNVARCLAAALLQEIARQGGEAPKNGRGLNLRALL